VRSDELAKYEAAGWHAISHYAVRSDDIESTMIGWFSDEAPADVV
jgi:hypothetical protein